MEELKKLYQVLSREGYYTKSFEDFKVQYEDSNYRDKVYGVVNRDGLYTKSRDDFESKYYKPQQEELTEEMMETGQREAAPAYAMTEQRYEAEKKNPIESPLPDGASTFTQLSDADEASFQEWWKSNETVNKWRDEFNQAYGYEPTLDGYDYRGAWEAGIEPSPTYEPETGETRYHWGSIGVDGKKLKPKGHPTEWKSDYMEATGINPDESGITKEQALLELSTAESPSPDGVSADGLIDLSVAAEIPTTDFTTYEQEIEVSGTDMRNYGYTSPLDQLGTSATQEDVNLAEEQYKADRDLTEKKVEAEETSLAELQKKEKKQAEEERALAEKANYETNLDEDFLKDLEVASFDMMGKKEEEVVEVMNDIYSKYGFSFRKTGIDNEMQVIAKNGEKKFIELNPILKSDQIESSRKLQKFLKDNAIPVTKEIAEVEKNEVKNAVRALNLRDVGRLNDDGTESTVLMSSGELDGKYVAYPTLFPKDPENYTSSEGSWMELDGMDAIKEAKNRNELFYFDTDEDAKTFAEGSWKGFSNADAEADLFFEKRGLNYMSYKNNYEQFEYANDRSAFLDDAPSNEDELTEEEAKKYGDLYVNGRLRSDAEKLQKDFEQQADGLREFVNDKDYLVTRYEFDSHMQEKFDKKAQVAANTNMIAKSQMEQANDMSVKFFGVPLIELHTYKPKTNEEIDKINSIVEVYSGAASLGQMAGSEKTGIF